MIDFELTVSEAKSGFVVQDVIDESFVNRVLVQPIVDPLLEAMDAIGVVSVWVGVRGTQGRELVTYATVNEFGSADGHTPERSYLRRTVDNHRGEYLDELEHIVAGQLDHDPQTMRDGLERLGALAVGDVQLTITELRTPPNAPSTVRQKGSANPLIDTGRLRQSIDYEIRHAFDEDA